MLIKDTLMNPKHPVYIISKGRWDSRHTSKALDKMNMPYQMVVEEDEYDNYASVIDKDKILILPKQYIEDYDSCTSTLYHNGSFTTDQGTSKGSGPARNFCWEHSLENGATSHWLLDDNIKAFGRINRNLYIHVTSGTIFKAAEDFIERYENIALAGFNYDFLAKAKTKIPPFVKNTRIYSCLLIRNDIPYRWRAKYNEDTDLSLRVLKDNWCTIQFNAFIQEKATTQTMTGGNTDEIYKNGTLNKSKMLEKLHPDVAKVVWKFNRWHHHVDYRSFKKNKLKRKEGLNIPEGINNYGMKVVKYENKH
jgi:hypothetical protein